MKIRRLSEIDLARIGPLDRDEKLRRLRMLKSGRPPHTYNPLRASLGDILNLQPEMFDRAAPTPWTQISADIDKNSRSASESKFNLGVAKALYGFGVKQDAKSYARIVSPWNVGYGQSVSYWWNFYTVIDDKACFLFIDPRLTARLNQPGRNFVFSLMHERIRAADPDFVDANLLIAQFDQDKAGRRDIRLFEVSDATLFKFDQLNAMIDETYQLWIEVLAERTEEAKRKSSGSTPFGF